MAHTVSLHMALDADARLGFHALMGALEASDDLADIEAAAGHADGPLLEGARAALARGLTPVLAFSLFSPGAAAQGARARALKQALGGRAVTLAGGPHVTADPLGAAGLGFDLTLAGEAEASLPELLRRLDAGAAPWGVPGLAAPGMDPAAYTPPKPFGAFGSTPCFSRRLRLIGPVEVSRGCPFGCAYCGVTPQLGARPRHRPLDAVLEHARTMRALGKPNLWLVSSDALSWGSPDGRAVDLAAIEALLAGLRAAFPPPNRVFFGSFPGEVRPEHVSPRALELIARHTDGRRLAMGAQSGSPRMLKACGRGHTVEDVRRAVALAAEAGFGADVDFIFGLPGEDEDDARATVALMDELAAMGACIRAHSFMPLPGTRWAGARPSPVPGFVDRAAARLEGAGRLSGVWRRQRALAAGS